MVFDYKYFRSYGANNCLASSRCCPLLADLTIVTVVDSMQLVVLGSGTSVFHARRAAAGFWLQTEAGSILLDCSADAPHRMAQENLDWSNLDAIWISHLHLDHCAGLAPFLFGIKWAPGIDQRQKPLRIFGCQGIEKLLKAIDDAHNDIGERSLADRVDGTLAPRQDLNPIESVSWWHGPGHATGRTIELPVCPGHATSHFIQHPEQFGGTVGTRHA